MRPDDQIRIQHILDAANQARQFAEGHERHDLCKNKQLLFALVKCIEIMGEAASKVSDEAKSLHNCIPWKQMTDMRNRLIHAYFDININFVWDTVTDEIPVLVQQLMAIVQPPST